MCIGSNFAINGKGQHAVDNSSLLNRSEIKLVVAAIYSNFTTSIFDDDGIEQTDRYTAPPTKTRLILKLEALNS